MRFLIRVLINAVALGLTFWLVDLCWDGQLLPLLIIALIFGFVNALIRPLVTILTCPLVILTLGLFLVVINGLMLWVTIWLSRAIGIGFTCMPEFFWNLIIGAIVLSIISGVATALIKDDRENR
ncbi:putative membrane protein [Candidatus Promineifilum breve]|uniref:Membrane protein n=1 Tax=Candidatus Promineifilum breve TaxID=1806508 RepID=A0A160T3I3_9CHLR|nr:phage holin family protein [Candidatus Promineifilum breve]CUS03100.2 putative membrane protein [Candidatus Promineifilum breve]